MVQNLVKILVYVLKIFNMLTGRKAELQGVIANQLGLSDSGSAPQWKRQQAINVINEVFGREYGLLNPVNHSQEAHTSSRNPQGLKLPEHLSQCETGEIVDETPRTKPYAEGSAENVAKIVKCFCLNPGPMPNMIQCKDVECGVWQHRACVARGREANLKDESFLCENCRLILSDPFWKPIDKILGPARLKMTVGLPPVRDLKGNFHAEVSIDQVFFLNGEQLEPCHVSPKDRQVFISCLLLEDEVPRRLRWPRNVSVRINGIGCRPYNRSLTAKIGINQRDGPLNATPTCLYGRNTLKISALESGTWIITIYIAERQTSEKVKSMMMPPETKDEAKERMKSLLVGDIEDGIGLEQITLSLLDPMTCQRIKMPARFDDASGPQAFDLDSFLSIVVMNRKWQDPTTLKNSTVKRMRKDTFVESILSSLESRQDITTIEVNAQGHWRPEGSTGKWYDIACPMTNADLEELSMHQVNQGSSMEETAELGASEAIDENAQILEAMSALVSIGAGAKGVSKDNGDENNTCPGNIAIVHPPLENGKKRKASVPEVIDLLSSDDE